MEENTVCKKDHFGVVFHLLFTPCKSTLLICVRKNNYVNILKKLERFIHSCLSPKVPPLTPSTNKKVGEVLKTTYASWERDSERLGVPKNPRNWSKDHVGHWLAWAIREFSLAGPNSSQFVQSFQVIHFKTYSESFEIGENA